MHGDHLSSQASRRAHDARFVPRGVQDLLAETYAPANWMEAVGTPAKEYYAKQIRKRDDSGIELLSQTNVLTYCTRPPVLIRGHNGA